MGFKPAYVLQLKNPGKVFVQPVIGSVEISMRRIHTNIVLYAFSKQGTFSEACINGFHRPEQYRMVGNNQLNLFFDCFCQRIAGKVKADQYLLNRAFGISPLKPRIIVTFL